MIGLAIIENRHDLAIALYLGFAGMFRASELCFLKLAHINVIGPLSAIISLRESKTAVRMANAEAVLIKDSCLVSLLKCRIARGNPQDALIGVRYNELSKIIKEYASFFGVSHPHVTPHSLRRGGATWHFKRCQNVDVVQALGRWSQARTAKLYIDEALADTSEAELSVEGRQQLRTVLAKFPVLIQRLLV